MDKEKIVKAAFWLLGFSTSVMISAIFLFIGFNNMSHGSYTIFIIGLLFLPVLFFCAFKGVKLLLESIFD